MTAFTSSLGPKSSKNRHFWSFSTLSTMQLNVDQITESEPIVSLRVYLILLFWLPSSKSWWSTVGKPTLRANVTSILQYFDHLTRRRPHSIQWKPPYKRLLFNQIRYQRRHFKPVPWIFDKMNSRLQWGQVWASQSVNIEANNFESTSEPTS